MPRRIMMCGVSVDYEPLCGRDRTLLRTIPLFDTRILYETYQWESLNARESLKKYSK